MIRGLDDVQIMLNYYYGVLVLGQTLKDLDELMYISDMKSGSGLDRKSVV